MHVKDAVRPAALIQCYHIHALAICMSKAARYFETSWNKPCGFDLHTASVLLGKVSLRRHYDLIKITRWMLQL